MCSELDKKIKYLTIELEEASPKVMTLERSKKELEGELYQYEETLRDLRNENSNLSMLKKNLENSIEELRVCFIYKSFKKYLLSLNVVSRLKQNPMVWN